MQRAALPGAGFGKQPVTAEEVMHQVDRLDRHLLDGDAWDVDGLACIAAHPHRVVAPVDPDRAIGVHHSGRVGQIGRH